MTVAAVDRCLRLIEALAGEPEPVELSSLAARVDLPMSATHRTLAAMSARGWVIQDPASQGYALSLRLAALGFRNLDARSLPDVVQDVLDRLATTTHEYCRLAILEGEDLVWVARAQGATVGLRYDPDMGEEIVLHATANGKAWLATLDEAEARRILTARGFATSRPLGPRCIADLDGLLAELERVRRNRYATAIEEAEEGTAAVAIPFRAGEGQTSPVAGTISVAGPLTRFPPERHRALADALESAAAELATLWPIRAYGRTGRAVSQQARVA
ncbi:IclR family transcriptional regulator [Acuticoccus sp. M5D2P5]|uniref:IclR family transcriptional regulator n=1 Tax=Acuticoccus kalidii TaxID=2910977 RepID=UPI001F41527A|nr:IclR family transcriptional regulator [Acuticoccus kalidii]MCF3931987.1 IclR family transcriptional regulator [Acuticoccus kalidii]